MSGAYLWVAVAVPDLAEELGEWGRESSPTLAARNVPCGKCDGCTLKDCGKCNNCLDKPKFGGHGKRRQRCICKRACSKPRVALPAAQSVRQVIAVEAVHEPSASTLAASNAAYPTSLAHDLPLCPSGSSAEQVSSFSPFARISPQRFAQTA